MQRYPNIFQYCALRTKNISDIFDLTKNTQFFCKPLYFGRDLRYNERINIRKIRIFRLPSKRKNGCSGYYPPDKAEERRVRRTQVFTMKTLGYYNGKFGPLDEMTVPMNDRVSYFGDGVYDARSHAALCAGDEHPDHNTLPFRSGPPVPSGKGASWYVCARREHGRRQAPRRVSCLG